VQHSRFVFLSLSTADEASTWMLVSPNNRPLGRAGRTFDTHAACRADVEHLRANLAAAHTTVAAVETTGQWVWRIDLAGAIVGVSSRSYLRARECHYNLDRFLEAVPAAQVVAGTRSVRGGRPASSHTAGDTAALPARPALRGIRDRHLDVPAPDARLSRFH